MTEYLPRSAWTDAPYVSGRVSWPAIKVVDVHWPASSGTVGTDPARVAQALRGWRRFHMSGRGWRDIAYNVGVDQAGRIWELRGWDRVDGGVAGRSDDVTILAILGMGEKPTDAMKLGILRAMRDFEERKGGNLRRTHHGALVSTTCPGPDLTAWSKAGFPVPAQSLAARVPGADTTTTDQEDNDMQIGELIDFRPQQADGQNRNIWDSLNNLTALLTHERQASTVLTGQVAGLTEAVTRLAGAQDVDGAEIIAAVERATREAVAAALPASVNVPLGGAS